MRFKTTRDWESSRHSSTTLRPVVIFEYIVPEPGQPNFDYYQESATFQQVVAHTQLNDRNTVPMRLNDPGPFRAVTGPNQNELVGMIYHPVGDRHGFLRAPMEPLARDGRAAMRDHRDRALFRSRSVSWNCLRWWGRVVIMSEGLDWEVRTKCKIDSCRFSSLDKNLVLSDLYWFSVNCHSLRGVT